MVDPTPKQPLAVFDFDETIVSPDTLMAFIMYMARRSQWRRLVVGCARVLLKPASWWVWARKARVSLLLWVGTVGLGDLEQYIGRFATAFFEDPIGGRAFPGAVERLWWHVNQGHKVVILSASMECLLAPVLRCIDADLPCRIVGSRRGRRLGGMTLSSYCSGPRKIPTAHAAGLPSGEWDYGYSDNARDFPMLRPCRKRYLISPTADTLKRVHAALGDDYEVLSWGECD